MRKWFHTAASQKRLSIWADEVLKIRWNFKAAARAYNIALSGFDAKVKTPYKGYSPSAVPVARSKRVPGIPEKSHTLFHISQILAWLAGQRRDLDDQLKWREEISDLIRHLRD